LFGCCFLGEKDRDDILLEDRKHRIELMFYKTSVNIFSIRGVRVGVCIYPGNEETRRDE
jgi:hypothetical protein